MKFEVAWIDVNEHLRTQQQPVHMHQRPLAHNEAKAWAGPSKVGRLGEFWTVQRMGDDGKIAFSVCRDGDFVRVPIIAYQTKERALASLFGLGVQIGLAAGVELRNHVAESPIEVLMVIGSECHDLPDASAFRCYIGISMRTK